MEILVLWYKYSRLPFVVNVMLTFLLGTLRSNDADDNENVKKKKKLV